MSLRILPEERTVMYSPVCLLMVDITTAGPPTAPVRLSLERRDLDRWSPTTVQATRTPSGAFAYPGLGRHRDPLAAGPHRHRAVVTSDAYLPLHRAVTDGLEFDVHPYDDFNPPAQRARFLRLQLAPSPAYGFAAGVPVLRGRVVATTGGPVADALVQAPYRIGTGPTRLERTLANRDGRFALPLRWIRSNVPTTVVAVDRRSQPSRRGSINVQLPAALDRDQEIRIS